MEPLLPFGLCDLRKALDHGPTSGQGPFDFPRRAVEPGRADAVSPVHAADECLFQEGGVSSVRHGLVLHSLQLLPGPSDIDQGE
jgi:hypothetical protein